MWPDLIQKAKDGGLDVIQTYVFWNGHEPSPGHVIKKKTFEFSFICQNVKKKGNSIFYVQKFSIILKIGTIWLSSSRWCNKLGFMFIFALVPTHVLNGTLGKQFL